MGRNALTYMSGNNLTFTTANNLRELALSVPEGQFLGTEKELLAQFGISRPTFRQAVHIIESERVVAKVRGMNGGLFSRRPDMEGVVASAATYLRSRGTTVGDVLEVASTAVVDAVRSASKCNDPALRDELAALIEELAAREDVPQSMADFRDDEIRWIDLLCRMCLNPALDLMVRVFYRVGVASFDRIFEGRAELMRQRRRSRLSLLRAIHEQDVEKATGISGRSAAHARDKIPASLLTDPMQSVHQIIAEDYLSGDELTA